MKNYLVAIIFILSVADASAMKCRLTSTEKLYKNSDFVFEAVVVKRNRIRENGQGIDPEVCWNYSEDNKGCGPKTATVKIKEIWKGKLKELPVIYSEDACYCLGSPLSEGTTYIFFSDLAGDDKPYDLISVAACGGIRFEKNFKKEKEIIKKLAENEGR